MDGWMDGGIGGARARRWMGKSGQNYLKRPFAANGARLPCNPGVRVRRVIINIIIKVELIPYVCILLP